MVTTTSEGLNESDEFVVLHKTAFRLIQKEQQQLEAEKQELADRLALSDTRIEMLSARIEELEAERYDTLRRLDSQRAMWKHVPPL